MQSKGSIFRGYLDALTNVGLLDEVKRRVPPATQALIEQPPLVSSWIDSAHNDALVEVYVALRGDEACADLGYFIITKSISAIVRPVLSGIVSILGASPHAVLSRVDMVASNHMRPLSFTYARLGDRSCELTMKVVDPLPAAGFPVWRGVLRYVFDICKVSGTIAPPRVADDRRSARFFAEWQAKA